MTEAEIVDAKVNKCRECINKDKIVIMSGVSLPIFIIFMLVTIYFGKSGRINMLPAVIYFILFLWAWIYSAIVLSFANNECWKSESFRSESRLQNKK